MNKKIVFIHHGTGIGGAALSLLNLIDKVKKHFDIKVIILFNSSVIKLFEEKGIDYEIIDYPYSLFIHSKAGGFNIFRLYNLVKIFTSWGERIKLAKKILNQIQPDLVHLNSTFLTEWAQAAKQLRIPVICHVREPLGNGFLGVLRKIIQKKLKSSADRIIAISKDNAKRINLPDKTIVSYNFVDFKVFNPDFYLKNEKEVINIAYLGGQAELKGFSWLVESLKYLDERIKVHFAGYYKSGENSLTSKLKSLISYRKRRINRNLKLMRASNNAIEVGVIKDVSGFLSKCDILAFPSTKPHFARPVIEANAMKRPVVISDIPGNNEIVQNGVNGFLVKKKSPLDLAEKINLLSGNRDLRIKMGQKGYEIAKEKFNAERNVKQILKIYTEILG